MSELRLTNAKLNKNQIACKITSAKKPPTTISGTNHQEYSWCSIGRKLLRTGTSIQIVELADFEIINYAGVYKDDGKAVGPSDMPASTINYEELHEGAQWRKDAIERIKNLRMGDINIKVTDKKGYPVTNAKIDVNMYEHEFQFGTCVSSTIFANSTYQEKFSENFNAAVAEHHLPLQ